MAKGNKQASGKRAPGGASGQSAAVAKVQKQETEGKALGGEGRVHFLEDVGGGYEKLQRWASSVGRSAQEWLRARGLFAQIGFLPFDVQIGEGPKRRKPDQSADVQRAIERERGITTALGGRYVPASDRQRDGMAAGEGTQGKVVIPHATANPVMLAASVYAGFITAQCIEAEKGKTDRKLAKDYLFKAGFIGGRDATGDKPVTNIATCFPSAALMTHLRESVVPSLDGEYPHDLAADVGAEVQLSTTGRKPEKWRCKAHLTRKQAEKIVTSYKEVTGVDALIGTAQRALLGVASPEAVDADTRCPTTEVFSTKRLALMAAGGKAPDSVPCPIHGKMLEKVQERTSVGQARAANRAAMTEGAEDTEDEEPTASPETVGAEPDEKAGDHYAAEAEKLG
jgi:hypothetical protein